jgi:hypothetical protein
MSTTMKWAGAPCVLQITLCIFTGCSAPTATRTSTGEVGGGKLTAIYSRADADYVRSRNPDGTFRPETYVFKSGGNFGGPRYDETMDKLGFDDVSRVIAQSLASQNYVPSEEPAAAKLMIMVYWGTTIVPGDVDPKDTRESVYLGDHESSASAMTAEAGPGGGPAVVASAGAAADFVHMQSVMQQGHAFAGMESIRDAQIDAKSANILGYTDEIFRTAPRSPSDPKLSTLRYEIEHDRYYVVLLAYDYQLARHGMQHKLLWETRFSIPEPGNDFEKSLPTMASFAANYYGQESHGLIHHNLGEGHVNVGEPKFVSTTP